jgi:hypothetical protein
MGPPPALLAAAYSAGALAELHALRISIEARASARSPVGRLLWLALASILRGCSHAGTASWQYVLPRKRKTRVAAPRDALALQLARRVLDMRSLERPRPQARLLGGDARSCAGVADRSIDLVVTSPPYANNYDYADATRLEQTFFGEVRGWGDLQQASRRHLVRACSQHTTAERLALGPLLGDAAVAPISDELGAVCLALGERRLEHAGRKSYHTMVAAYFGDLSRVFSALGRVVRPGGRVCFVVGDSAPYGVHVPVDEWFVRLAHAQGFSLEERRLVRARNVKWKNRKHRVPLQDVELWWVRR